VVVAGESVLWREGLAKVLTDAGFEVVGTAADPAQALARIDEERPDVALFDVGAPSAATEERLRVIEELRTSHPMVGVVLLSPDVEVSHAVKLLSGDPRRVGYLLTHRVSHVQEVADAIRRVAAGEAVIDPEVVGRLVAQPRTKSPLDELTDRERDVLALMAEGRSNQAICARLHLSGKTVEGYVASLFAKLGLEPAESDHRRVLAVLTYLQSR
jgi:DNA-binding NarL/FixJ family response regulator